MGCYAPACKTASVRVIGREILKAINESDSMLVKSRLQQAHDKLMSAIDVMNYRHLGVSIVELGLNDERKSDRRANN